MLQVGATGINHPQTIVIIITIIIIIFYNLFSFIFFRNFASVIYSNAFL
jgi:hypothetical protein